MLRMHGESAPRSITMGLRLRPNRASMWHKIAALPLAVLRRDYENLAWRYVGSCPNRTKESLGKDTLEWKAWKPKRCLLILGSNQKPYRVV